MKAVLKSLEQWWNMYCHRRDRRQSTIPHQKRSQKISNIASHQAANIENYVSLEASWQLYTQLRLCLEGRALKRLRLRLAVETRVRIHSHCSLKNTNSLSSPDSFGSPRARSSSVDHDAAEIQWVKHRQEWQPICWASFEHGVAAWTSVCLSWNRNPVDLNTP